jgi:hypothetical protein
MTINNITLNNVIVNGDYVINILFAHLHIRLGLPKKENRKEK